MPKDPNPTWMGYSVGHWDGDTLVVETAGFNDKGWLDNAGRPATGCAACHGAADPGRTSGNWALADHDRRSESVYEAVDGGTGNVPAAGRHRSARIRVQRKQQRPGTSGGQVSGRGWETLCFIGLIACAELAYQVAGQRPPSAGARPAGGSGTAPPPSPRPWLRFPAPAQRCI